MTKRNISSDIYKSIASFTNVVIFEHMYFKHMYVFEHITPQYSKEMYFFYFIKQLYK